MICSQCRNDEFYATEEAEHRVILDSEGNVDRVIELVETTVRGPYECTQCGAEYDELEN